MSSKKKIIILSVVTLVLLSLCLYLKSKNVSLVRRNEEFSFGDIGDGILLDSLEVNFSNSALGSKNVGNAIDELYSSFNDGCQAGYYRSSSSGGTYTCTKRTSGASQAEVFQAQYVHYDNTFSGLTATNVNSAILELAAVIPSCKSGYGKTNTTSTAYDCKTSIVIKALNQRVGQGESISQNPGMVMVTGLKEGDYIYNITLTPNPNTSQLTNNGTITPSNVVIKDEDNNTVTSTYAISYTTGTLVVTDTVCYPPTNVTISTAGVVTWTASSNADSYQISIDNNTYVAAVSGVNYKSTLLQSTGTRTVYVKSLCTYDPDEDDPVDPESSPATGSINVYQVTLKKGTGIEAVSGEGKYLHGSSVTITAVVKPGYTWNNWTIVSGGSTSTKTSNPYTSSTITKNWECTANATGNSYTIYYRKGSGTDTTASTQIGTQTCTFGTACKLKTWSELGAVFPLSSASSSNYGWSFYGWASTTNASSCITNTTITYSDGQSINPTVYSQTIYLFSIGRKTYKFSRGIEPTTRTIVYQYWNPCNTGTSYRTAIDVPAMVDLSASSNGSWTALGYVGGSNSVTSDTVSIAVADTGKSFKPEVNTCSTGTMRSKYKRTLTVNYNGNGGSGTMTASTKVQRYNSGVGNGSTNSGSTLGDNTITLKDNEFTKTGYTFDTWAAGSASGAQFPAGTAYTGRGGTIKSTALSTTMYAIWNINKYNITYNYQENVSYNDDEYLDTGYKVNWDRNFRVTVKFQIPALGVRHLIISSYNDSAKTFTIEVNASNQLRLYLGSGAVDANSGSTKIPINTTVTAQFTWDAAKNKYTLTGTASGMDSISITGTLASLSGTGTKNLITNRDWRGTGTFKKISISSLTIRDTREYNTSLSDLPTAAKAGTQYSGWYTEAGGGDKISTSTKVTATTTYYLRKKTYTKKTYPCTYGTWGSGVDYYVSTCTEKTQSSANASNYNQYWTCSGTYNPYCPEGNTVMCQKKTVYNRTGCSTYSSTASNTVTGLSSCAESQDMNHKITCTLT